MHEFPIFQIFKFPENFENWKLNSKIGKFDHFYKILMHYNNAEILNFPIFFVFGKIGNFQFSNFLIFLKIRKLEISLFPILP